MYDKIYRKKGVIFIFPISSIVYLTTECKLNCKHCFIRNIYGDAKIHLDFTVLKKVINDFSENNMYLVSFTGGDIQYYKHLFEIIDFTYNKGMLPLLGLSGTDLSDDFIKNLSNYKFGCVQVSLDGSSDKYNSFTRPQGTFYEIITNIKKIQNYNINVNVAICLHKDNFNDFANILRLLFSIKVYKVKVQFYYEQNTEIKCLSNLEKKMAIEICNNFQKINNICDWISIDNDTDIAKYHSNSIIVTADGYVCWNESGPYLGNIYHDNIREIVCK